VTEERPAAAGMTAEARAEEGYQPSAIEPKWQARWAADGLYERPAEPARPHYALTMYPYPSGNLHIGHWYAFTPSDAHARYMRMRGRDVFFPMGFDAFGLPAENAAIERGVQPREWTMANIEHMRGQMRSMGAMFDWSAEVVTCLPRYYRWNQWFFLRMLERGLAYRRKAAVDFCPKCNTTLAREQVVGEARLCERCGTPVEKRELEQWFLRITDYADELLAGLEDLDWPERVKTMQRNWIGRSEGAEIEFELEDDPTITLPVFTTRPDTIYGATALVLAPEHPMVPALTRLSRKEEVEAYRAQAARRTEIDRLATDREKTGVFTGSYVLHPLTGEPIEVWIADYVLTTYGTGAVMLVPGHDERDFAFAKRHYLDIREVIRPADAPHTGAPLEAPYLGPGIMVNSGPADGLVSTGKYDVTAWTPELAQEHGLPADIVREGKEIIVAALDELGMGRAAVTTRLRDWLISRQRYWGTPIPVVHCESCGIVPVPEEDLPVELPEGVEFRPTGESPLRLAEKWVAAACPRCGEPAQRDTDTMDTFVDSSWYQYRYLSPGYEHGPFDPAAAEWLPVEQYTGGIEHATMHLLYTRFWTKVMRDLGLVEFDEPMLRLFNQGIILGEDSEKMSKSRGNVVDPDDLVARYGADAVRVYLMFIGPWDQGGPWDPRGIQGVTRWLNDVWDLALATPPAGRHTDGAAAPDGQAARALRRATHQTIAKVGEDLAAFAFHTAVAALMELRNTLKGARTLAGTAEWDEAVDALLLMAAPLAPHITEDLWARRGRPYSIHQQPWPAHDPAVSAEETFELAIQVNGKIRDRLVVPVGVTETEAIRRALASEPVEQALDGREPQRVIYVPGRLVNLVV
jgi:leucyl-tRNA synthetase